MIETEFSQMFPLAEDVTAFRKLDFQVSLETWRGEPCLIVASSAIRKLTTEAYLDLSHLYRRAHLEQLRTIIDDQEASANDRFIALQLLKNAVVSAGGVLPMCQDTGTAIVMGSRGHNVWVEGDESQAISEGVAAAFSTLNLRFSQLSALSMFDEINTGNNLPAQIELFAVRGNRYDFLFIAKGGGSANKSLLFQESKAILNSKTLVPFLERAISSLGTAACPPYHLAVVVGGTSAELTMKTVKLASTKYLDSLPRSGNRFGQAFRDVEMEEQILDATRRFGIGAQFGGKYFCHDVRVIRLPRHAGSCPIGLGVSCSADRQALAKITKDGVFLEELEVNPALFLPDVSIESLDGDIIQVDLNKPLAEVREFLSQYPVATRLALTGPMVAARDLVHAKLKERLDAGIELPDYLKRHPVYYASPAKTPEGYASGAFGATTSARMDPYVSLLQEHGGSLVMIGKGNRSETVTEACKLHGGFYLGTIGGNAATLAESSIRKTEVLEFPELGMEAVWRIEVVDLPAFIVVDDKGNDFFSNRISGQPMVRM